MNTREHKWTVLLCVPKYIGETFGVSSLTNGKIYKCIEVDYPFLRIIDDSNEDYLYSIEKPCSMENPELCGKWVIVEDTEGILQQYIK